MKKKHLILAITLTLSMNILASQKDDLRFINALYKEKNFEMALSQSKTFIKKYPESKYSKNIVERIAKVYFLQGNYPEAINYFKILLMDENIATKKRDEINYYLTKSYAELNDFINMNFSLERIDTKSKYYEKSIYESGVILSSHEKYEKASKFFDRLIVNKGKYYDRALLNLGTIAYNEKQYTEANKYILSYLNNGGDENNIFMNYLLGSSYYKMKDKVKAIETLSKITQDNFENPYVAQSILTLIEIYSENNDFENADKLLAKLNKTNDIDKGLEIIGITYAQNKEFSKALANLNQIKNPMPKVLYTKGFSYYNLKDYANSYKCFEKLKNTTYYADSLFYIFSIDYHNKNYAEIMKNINLLSKYKVSASDMKSLDLIIANSAYNMKNYKVSREYFSKLNVLSLENIYRMIVLDSKLNDLNDIHAQMNEYLSKFPNDTEYRENIYLLVGQTYYNNKDLTKSQEIYEEYLSQNRSYKILNNLIGILLETKQYDKLIALLSKAPDNLDTKYLKAVSYIGIGEYKNAETLLDEIIVAQDINPNLLEKARLNRIRNMFLMSEYKNTIEFGKTYLNDYKDSKNTALIYEKLALSYFRLGDFAESRTMYQKLLDIIPNKDYAMFQIADTYYAEKDYENAIKTYDEIILMYPNTKYAENSDFWALNALYKMKKFDVFVSRYNEFIEKYPTSSMLNNVYILASLVYQDTDNTNELLKIYEKMYDKTKDEEVLNQMVEVLIKTHDYEKATGLIEKLTNVENKDYYESQILIAQGKINDTINILENLYNTDKYKDYASLELANFYYEHQNYEKAKIYYETLDNLDNSKYKDYAIYQLANISEIEGNYENAYVLYVKSYTMYKGEYELISKLKAAEMAGIIGKNDVAQKLYEELEDVPNFKHRAIVLEKLLYLNLYEDKLDIAKKYHEELKEISPEVASKYDEFFMKKEDKPKEENNEKINN